MTVEISAKNLTFIRQIRDGSKKFENAIFQNFSIEIFQGDRVALIGQNGSGKSTLLRILSGILKPDIGSITISTKVTTLLDSGFGVDTNLSGRDNVNTMLILNGTIKSSRSTIIETVRLFSELGEYFEQPIKTYSTGMTVRLILSTQLAILDNTGLIIDEGFGNADASFQNKTFDRIDAALRNVPFMILASHDENMLRKYCNRGIIIEKGRLHFDGNIDEALHAYRSMYTDK
jgi:ABC-type polysaccharide/polyol phosphate transport system ATPase subunit